MSLPPIVPQLHSIDPQIQANIQWMWTQLLAELAKPTVVVDTIANQGNYPAANYKEGTEYFASDTHHLYVDSYASGTPTWVQVV